MNRKHEERPVLQQARYRLSDARVGVVHVGVGAFHRAHQAMYFDRLMDETGDLRWAIAGVNLRAQDSAQLRRMQENQGRYVLKTLAPEGTVGYRLIQVHKAFYDWAHARDDAEAIIANRDVKILTITVTESGYYTDHNNQLNFSDPVIQSEITGGAPVSIYGYLYGALKRRAQANAGPIMILCCDNFRANGLRLQENLCSYVRAKKDESLLAWLTDHASFPCSMVDRITPRTTDALGQETQELFGEPFAVQCETFTQWVLEDRFAIASPPELEKVGVEITDDVHPFEEAKIRLLNGGHLALAYFGALRGYETYDQALADPELEAFLDCYKQTEARPAIDSGSPVDLVAYDQAIKKRFANVALADRNERIAMDGFSKISIFIKPTIESCLAMAIYPEYAIRIIASWYIFLRRVTAGQIDFDYHDPQLDRVIPYLATGREKDFATWAFLWGSLPARYPSFVDGLTDAIAQVDQQYPSR